MSSFLDEHQIAMPPMSKVELMGVGEALVGVLQPEALRQPVPLDVLDLVDRRLQKLGVDVYPVADDEIPGSDGETDPTGDRARIHIRQGEWDDLLRGGARALHPRATVVHELSHVALHVPVIRRRLAHPHASLLLRRVSTGQLKTYEQPEWQAWCLAGCILMPQRTVRMLPFRTAETVAAAFEVSVGFARSHLKRYPELLGGSSGR